MAQEAEDVAHEGRAHAPPTVEPRARGGLLHHLEHCRVAQGAGEFDFNNFIGLNKATKLTNNLE